MIEPPIFNMEQSGRFTMSADAALVDEAREVSMQRLSRELPSDGRILDSMFPLLDEAAGMTCVGISARGIRTAHNTLGVPALWLAHEFLGVVIEQSDKKEVSKDQPMVVYDFAHLSEGQFAIEVDILKPNIPCRAVRYLTSRALAPFYMDLQAFRSRRTEAEYQKAILSNLLFGGKGLQFHVGKTSEFRTARSFNLEDDIITLRGYDVKPYEEPIAYLAAATTIAYTQKYFDAAMGTDISNNVAAS